MGESKKKAKAVVSPRSNDEEFDRLSNECQEIYNRLMKRGFEEFNITKAAGEDVVFEVKFNRKGIKKS